MSENKSLRGGKREGAGRKKIEGLKERRTTATDEEWAAMVDARKKVRESKRPT